MAKNFAVQLVREHTLEEFRLIREHDLACAGSAANWIARWNYGQEYQQYHGPDDLIRWLQWYEPYVHYLPTEQIEPLARLSEARNREILGRVHTGDYRFRHVDEYSASDYIFQNLYPVPERMRIKRILDFGPGFGRQVNLWSQLCRDLVYVGLEAIELPYSLQNYYYAHFDLPIHEYLDDPERFRVREDPGIYHLPTWRSDLLPDNFFDLVICVQVLQEIPKELVRYMLRVFGRCLKPGGALYIRDHGTATHSIHRLDIGRLLEASGFVLEFRPYVVDSHYALHKGHRFPPEVHGLPRIWRRKDPRYPVVPPLRPAALEKAILLLDRLGCGLRAVFGSAPLKLVRSEGRKE